MELISFTRDDALAEQFIQLPYRLYHDDPHYIAPQIHEQRQYLCPGSPLYNGCGVTARHFVARTNGSVVGRITAFVNPALHDIDNTPVGAIGLFECIDDYSVACALLTNSIDWLARGHGLHRIWGPMNGDIWHGYRFLTRGFDAGHFVGEPYNPPYYPAFFDRFGFKARREWDSLFVEGPDRIRQMIARGEQRLNLLLNQGYRFETFDPNRSHQQIAHMHQVMTASFSSFLGFTPVSLEQVEQLFGRFAKVFDPDFFLLTYDPNGTPVGFALALPDMREGIKAMRGHNSLAAKCSFLLHRDRHPRLNFYLGGITPDQERRAAGLGRAGFYYVINKGLEKGYDCIMLTLRLKGNEAHGLAARSGVVPQHEYALYEYDYAG